MNVKVYYVNLCFNTTGELYSRKENYLMHMCIYLETVPGIKKSWLGGLSQGGVVTCISRISDYKELY